MCPTHRSVQRVNEVPERAEGKLAVVVGGRCQVRLGLGLRLRRRVGANLGLRVRPVDVVRHVRRGSSGDLAEGKAARPRG